MRGAFLCLLLVSTSFGLLTPSAHAQSASVNGQVVDPSGALVRGVEITLTNLKTNTVQHTRTNSAGMYILSFVTPGSYSLNADASGFKPYMQTNITVSTAQTLELDIRVQVGGPEQLVTVDGSGAQINTTDASVSTVVDRTFVENIPLNGRSFQSLISMLPGVTIVPSNSGSSGTGSVSGEYTVNGQRTEANYFTVDGVSSNTGTGGGNPGVGAGYSGSTPSLTLLGTTQSIVSLDALQEFRATTSTFSAEYGRTPGGQFTFQTRSGANDWHGTLFDYFRNDALDANNYFNNRLGTPRQPEKQNDFGGTLGGPVRVPHLYNGKDKTFFFFSYEGLRLRVPVATAQYSVPTVALRQAVPAALKPFLNAFPIPNGADRGSGMAYFAGAYTAPSRLDSSSIRIDHQISNRHKIFGRYAYTPSSSLSRGSGDLAQSTNSDAQVSLVTLGLTSVLGSRIANDFRFNITNNKTNSGLPVFDNYGGATPFDLRTVPSIADPSRTSFSLIMFINGAFPYMQSLPWPFQQKQINVVNNLSAQIGRHALKWGVDYRRLSNVSRIPRVDLFGFFNTEQQLLSNTPFLNKVTRYQGDVRPVYSSFSAYAQDDWKVSPRLSLSYGVRWELAPAPKDAGGNNPYTVTTTDLATMALAPKNSSLWKATYGNFAPRFGSAYQIHQTPGFETVLRGGVGLFYDVSLSTAGSGYYLGLGSSAVGNFGGTAFAPSQSQIDSVRAPSVASPYTGAVYASDPSLSLPYALEWNVALEQSLGQSQSVTLSYVASSGRRLYLVKEYFPQTAGNARFSLGNGVFLTNNGASSDYNSLQVQYNRKLFHGLQAMLSTTWAHALDDATSNFQIYTQQRASSDNDVRLNFQGATTYALPGQFSQTWLSTLASHWSVDARVSARSALPVDVMGNLGVDKTGTQVRFHPNRIAGVPLYVNSPTAPGGRLINCSAFIANCNTALLPATEGNAGRNIARSFRAVQTDLAVRKEFPIHDQVQLQFRVEALNLFNHPILGSVNNLLTDGAADLKNATGFGVATKTLNSALGGLNSLYQVGGPRSLQAALKLHF